MSRHQRHRLVALLGVVGAVLGVLAGLAQAALGSTIPEWTGAKAAPGPLGLLTMALSLVAGLAAFRQTRPDLNTGSRAITALTLIVPGLLCFTTVGRLWYVPGALLIVASLISVDGWRETGTLVARSWMRCLLAILGASELVMAAGAPTLLLTVGAVGGLSLIAASWLTTPRRGTLVGLLIIGTVPFAVVAWTAVVPVLLLVVAAGIAIPLVRQTRLHHQINT
jgi:hypothetical protein